MNLIQLRDRNRARDLDNKKTKWSWGAALMFFGATNATIFVGVSLSGLNGISIGLLISLVCSNWFAYISLQDYLASQDGRRLKDVNQFDVSDSK